MCEILTFSIVGYDPNNGDYGVAVQSKFLCVGSIVPWARAKVGAIAIQAGTNSTYGPKGLAFLESGMSSNQVIAKLLENDELKETGQLAVIDSQGNAAAFTGNDCFEWAGHQVGEHYSCQGNILVGEETIQSMASSFEREPGDLINKLIAALVAADQEGRGDARGKQSACILVVRDKAGYGGFDRLVDIRVDEHPEPIKELQRIFQLYELTFLSRESPEHRLPIEAEIATNMKTILEELGYLDPKTKTPMEGWDRPERDAFEWWIGINNFENKWRDDGTVWKSIYEYMLVEKGTPFVSLRKMSEQ